MGLFNMMETVFIISLAILFVLTGLLLYHIRSRIVSGEQRIDNLYEIATKLSNEISATRVFAANMRYLGNETENIKPFQPTEAVVGAGAGYALPVSTISVKKIIVSDDDNDDADENTDEEIDTSDEDSDSDDENNTSSEDGDEDDDAENDKDVDDAVDLDIEDVAAAVDEIKEKIATLENIYEENVDFDFDKTKGDETADTEKPEQNTTTTAEISISTLSLSELKKLATKRGHDASKLNKLKKNDLLLLLQ
jgi:hypothetical protein